MNLRQTIQTAPAKANELIDKLSNTSNQAVKTREGLFAELTNELSRYVELEEQHLLPLLRKHPETKALATDALKGNKELRARLAELDRMPKDNDAFLAKVTELKKGFQEHVRDERKELIPAVMKALSDEEAREVAGNIEEAVAEAEKAKRDAKREEAAQAKREAEEAERVEEEKRAAIRAEKAAERASREAADEAAKTIQRGAASVQEGARRVTEGFTEQTKQAASQVRDALTAYRGSTENAAEDLRAISASSTIAANAVSNVSSVWVEWARKAAAVNAEASRRMMQCKSVGEFAQVQGEFVRNSMRAWIEGSTAVLEITQRASKQALDPLAKRLDQAA